jgi:Ni,Fe-hydrogenase I large subunit
MATTRLLDPITRIEGHMAVNVTANSSTNVITGVDVEGTMFRGFELIMKNRNPRDVSFLTQRICGV